MHREVALAQADTLSVWADAWEYDAIVWETAQFNSVITYLRQAKCAIQALYDAAAKEDLGLQAYPDSEPVMVVKDG